jgi:hypothetical protein
MKRIERYFVDADAHRKALTEAMDELVSLPLTPDGLRSATKFQRFAMEVLLFRFGEIRGRVTTTFLVLMFCVGLHKICSHLPKPFDFPCLL